MCGGTKEGSYLRLIDFLYRPTLGLRVTALETTQGQIDGFFSQLPYKCYQNRVASVES